MVSSTKVLLFATHIHSTNGYCLVGHALARELAGYDDIELTYYGFQNFHKNPAHMSKRVLPNNVYVYDAFENENPKSMGFGFDQVTEFVTMNKPDVCVIYNDMVVVSTILDKLKAVPNRKFKIIVYIDQVYLYQKKEFIKRLNEEADMVLAFTPFWQDCIVKQGLTKPVDYLQHGFDPKQHYPVPKELARTFFGLKMDDFIVLNLNRNQPRKRWDVCLQAFAEVVSRHLEDPIKLLIATAVNGAWNLLEVYERELAKRGVTLEEGMKHVILIDNPQQITDEEVNILYNVADIGLTTCDGEGFGLCSFQQAAIGVPQVLPGIGGFLDFFNGERSIVVEPKLSLYIDNSRDGVGGECQICDWRDIADGIEAYYSDRELIKKHGENARKYIVGNYGWKGIGEKLYKICKNVCGHEVGVNSGNDKGSIDSEDLVLEDLEVESSRVPVVEKVERKKLIVVESPDSSDNEDAVKQRVVATPKKGLRNGNDIKARLREKLEKKRALAAKPVESVVKPVADNNEDIDIKSLLELKEKIDRLIAAKG